MNPSIIPNNYYKHSIFVMCGCGCSIVAISLNMEDNKVSIECFNNSEPKLKVYPAIYNMRLEHIRGILDTINTHTCFRYVEPLNVSKNCKYKYNILEVFFDEYNQFTLCLYTESKRKTILNWSIFLNPSQLDLLKSELEKLCLTMEKNKLNQGEVIKW